ncbi:MAG TPA: riboflavin synthase [Chitinophagales bacterium]|nr:riboflavin synthase [Chitinophagales bacterium]
MFTGIIENVGEITQLNRKAGNLIITVKCAFSNELKIDQSVAHNGVCLTVVSKTITTHTVVAIDETLQKTNLNNLKIGDKINVERAMSDNTRFDGHIVQGHVDQTAEIYDIEEKEGSWNFTVKFIKKPKFTLVDKGSVCIDGVSLTVVKAKKRKFIVSIIPYTFRHTLFYTYKAGTVVNIEFDVIGKYVETLIKKYR